MDLSESFEPIRKAVQQRNLPGVEECLSYGTPAFKVRGKLLLRLREPDVVVLPCEIEEKDFLKQMGPDVYFETDHYAGYPWILAYVSRIDLEDLADRVQMAWRGYASRKMVDDFDSRNG